MAEEIFLDYNATSVMKPEVISAMTEVFKEPLNASSVHKFGSKAKKYIDHSVSVIKQVFLADDYEVVFTGSGTEANNLALKGTDCDLVIVSEIEHNSVLSCVPKDSLFISCNSDGYVNTDMLEQLLEQHKDKKILVSVMLVNNETGVIQPIKDVIDISKKYGAAVHVDAIQAVGKISFDLKETEADLVSLSAHKFGGPQGTGALLFKEDIKIKSQIEGGGQQQGIRSGTEDIASIYGMAKALESLEDDILKMKEAEAIRDYLEDSVKSISPESVIYGKNSLRIPNTSLFTMPYVNSDTQLIYFDLNHIAVSAGSACSSGKISESHVLKAMGVCEKDSSCSIRVSLGKETGKEEIENFIDLWAKLYTRCSLGNSSLAVQTGKFF